jgi:hypothetical protein
MDTHDYTLNEIKSLCRLLKELDDTTLLILRERMYLLIDKNDVPEVQLMLSAVALTHDALLWEKAHDNKDVL